MILELGNGYQGGFESRWFMGIRAYGDAESLRIAGSDVASGLVGTILEMLPSTINARNPDWLRSEYHEVFASFSPVVHRKEDP